MARLSALEWLIGSLGKVPARSSTYKMKRAWPWTQPWRTPRLIRNERFRVPLKRTFALPSDRKDCVQQTMNDGKPRARNWWKRRRLGVTVWSDPSRNLPRHFGPLLSRGVGTALPRWGNEALLQILMILMQILMHTLARNKCNFVQYIILWKHWHSQKFWLGGAQIGKKFVTLF